MWCVGCYVENLKDDFPKYGKESGVYQEGYLEGIYDKGGWEITCLQIFSVTCDAFEILREETRPRGSTNMRD